MSQPRRTSPDRNATRRPTDPASADPIRLPPQAAMYSSSDQLPSRPSDVTLVDDTDVLRTRTPPPMYDGHQSAGNEHNAAFRREKDVYRGSQIGHTASVDQKLSAVRPQMGEAKLETMSPEQHHSSTAPYVSLTKLPRLGVSFSQSAGDTKQRQPSIKAQPMPMRPMQVAHGSRDRQPQVMIEMNRGMIHGSGGPGHLGDLSDYQSCSLDDRRRKSLAPQPGSSQSNCMIYAADAVQAFFGCIIGVVACSTGC